MSGSSDERKHFVGGKTSPASTSAVRPSKRPRVAEDQRRRAVRACTVCRRLKEKCNGCQPCERCSRTGHKCEFTAMPRASRGALAATTSSAEAPARLPLPRGVGSANSQPPVAAAAPDVIPPSLSTSSATDASALPASDTTEERVRCLETVVTHLLGDVPTDIVSLRRLSDRLTSTRRQASSASNHESPGAADLDGVHLDDEHFTVKTLSPNTAHYSGEFSHWNFSQRVRKHLGQFLGIPTAASSIPVPPFRARSDGKPSSRRRHGRRPKKVIEHWRATQLQSPRTLIVGVLAGLPPRHVARFLVQMYFGYAQTSCFFVEERWLRGKLVTLYDAPGSLASDDAAWVCSVLIVLAIGAQFAHLAGTSGPGHGIAASSPPTAYASAEDDVSLRFYQMATKLIPDIITIASMESMQACLLLAHYALPLDTQGLAYTYLGLSIKMAIQNGMHRKYGGRDLDGWTIETRNRLWWTAYTVERRVTILHGRPASISPADIDADLPRDVPELRTPDSSRQLAGMLALIDMTVRLSEIANAITLLRRCPETLQPAYFDRIVDLWHKLQTWWAAQPESLRRVDDPTMPGFRANIHLALYFHLAQIFVGRPFVFAESPGRPAASSTQSPTRRSMLVSSAITSAFDVLRLCARLHETIGLARASYAEFSACRAALLLLLAQGLHEYSPLISDTISRGVRLLEVMAAGSNVSTRSETSVVAAIEAALRWLHKGKEGNDDDDDDDGDDDDEGGDGMAGSGHPTKSGYERFKEWTSFWKGLGSQPTVQLGQAPQQLQLETDLTLTSDGVSWPLSNEHSVLADQTLLLSPAFPPTGQQGATPLGLGASLDWTMGVMRAIPDQLTWEASGNGEFNMSDFINGIP